ncbi:hypothetical protein [Rhodospirillum sp. A1_3_36]|uniref:hypothetical protein n=1 Tax=Rhodospirillum sp. A1_3_36 TaxID=3391666 RepID=UPI0039A48319
MAVDAITSLPQAPRDTTNPGYRLEGDKVINDDFMDGFTFWDALDVINPLQHIPVVNTIYRELTDDQIKAGPRLAGGVLFGGVVGLAGAAVNVLAKELTGKDLGEHAVALFDMAVNGEETVKTAQVNPPSGQAESAQALAQDPNAPLDLLPPRWRMAANTGMTTAALGGSSLTTQGTMPSNLPLGDGALAPLGDGAASPAVSPTPPRPGSVDIVLPQRAEAASSVGQTPQVAGRAPVNPPLGDDALGMATRAPAQSETVALRADRNPAQTAVDPATATSRQPRSLSETREFAGKSLDDYRNRAVRFNAGRSTRSTSSQTHTTGQSSSQSPLPDPAAMAQLLEAQAASRPLSASGVLKTASNSASSGTTEGDVLQVGQTGAGSKATTTIMEPPGGESPRGGSPEGGEIDQDAWFAQKMMMGLEKYQKARGSIPLTRAAPIDA